MAWVDATTVFGHGPPDVTCKLRGEVAMEATEVDRRPLGDAGLAFDDDETAPYLSFDWDPTDVDGRPLR